MFFRAILLLLVLIPGAFSQSANFTFSLTDTSGNLTTLPPGGAIQFPATPAGGSSSVTVGIINRGAGPGTLLSVSVLGDAFQLSGVPLSGTNIPAASSVSFTLKFAPVQLVAGQGSLRIVFTNGTYNFALAGTALGAGITYQLQQGSSLGALLPLQAITFPDTALGQQSSVTIQVSNLGNASGPISDIAIQGSGYQLTNLPFLPVTLAPSSNFSFNVVFAPSQFGPSPGRLKIGNDTFALSGNALGPSLAFSYNTTGTPVSVQNNGTVLFTPAVVGGSSTSAFSIVNQGSAPAVVTSIGLGSSVTVFSIPNLPALPLTLTPGAAVTFTARFSPAATGVVTGTLVVDTQTFTLSGSGTSSGISLAFSYAAGGGKPVTVQSGGTVALGSAAVGSTVTAIFAVSNQGTAAATLNSIAMSGAGFGLSGLPALPLTLAPGQSATFTLSFAPPGLGASTATLNIDAQSFTLTANGASPTPLPSYSFSGAASVQSPLTQPTIGLALSAPYALPLTGTLTLSFVSDVFADDPSIQFATGNRVVSFTVPPNTTSAVFNNGSTSIRFSTGTVAGAISVTPSFATGGISVTPDSPLALRMTVAQLTPAVLSAQVDSKNATGFTLSFTGLATGRNVTQVNYHFTMAPNVPLTVPDITLNVEPSFTTWFQSSASQQFGGLFSAAVPFTLTGQVQGFASLVNAIQSVTVTLTNRQGVSLPQTVQLQ